MEGQARGAMEFLFYAYFKLDIHAGQEEIINKAIERAYEDATNEGAYNSYLYSDMKNPTAIEKKERKKDSDGVRGLATKCIRGMINALADIDSESAFDDKHDETCQALVKHYEEKLGLRKFTYGNAQKWVNMTMKYLYLIDGVRDAYGETLSIHVGLAKCQKWFHVPIDSYIMEALYKDIEFPGREQGRPFDKVKKLAFNTAQSGDLLPWSKWEQKDYQAVYQKIRSYAQKVDGHICPLIWENSAWITVAKSRKK